MTRPTARREEPRRSPTSGVLRVRGATAYRYAELNGVAPAQVNLVTLHLGNGSSACAIRGGRSVDTSMGFTPLEGLVMGTRSGDLDPALVSYLARKENVDAEEIERWLNERSGLRGMSGISSDMRELIAAYENDLRARLAVEVFCYRARKYLGAYLAALGGADAVVFSGGIGENAPLGVCVIRNRSPVLRSNDHKPLTTGASSYSSSCGYRCALPSRGRSLVKRMRSSVP